MRRRMVASFNHAAVNRQALFVLFDPEALRRGGVLRFGSGQGLKLRRHGERKHTHAHIDREYGVLQNTQIQEVIVG